MDDPESQQGRKSEEQHTVQTSSKWRGRVAASSNASALQRMASSREMVLLARPGERIILCFGVICAVAHGVAQPLTTVFFGRLINTFGESASSDSSAMLQNVEPLCLTLAIFGVVTILVAMLQLSCFKYFGETLARTLRVRYLEAVLRQDLGWFDTQRVNALPTQMASDVDAIAEAFGQKTSTCLMSISCFVFGFIIAFVISWQLALVMLSVLAAIALGLAFAGRALRSRRLMTQDWYGQAGSLVEECLNAVRTVVAFGGEQRAISSYEAAVCQAEKAGVRNGSLAGFAMAWIMTVMHFGFALAFYYGGVLVKGQTLLPGTIMNVFFCILIAATQLANIRPGAAAWRDGRAAAARLIDTVRHISNIEALGNTQKQKLGAIDHFEMQDVSFRYPGRPDVGVLQGLSLRITTGQKTAIVGASGSGKSTVISLLERFYDPQKGTILVNGDDIKSFDVGSIRNLIGYVGQEPVLFATSVRKNILLGCKVGTTDESLAKACDAAQLKFVDSLPMGLDTFVGASGSQFSGGQKQRIAIARALIKKASFLFLDEATSALDNSSERMIQATLDHIGSSMAGSLGIVTIAHRLSTIRDADVIIVMQQGAVVETGSHDQLMEAKSFYHALVAAQHDPAEAGNEEPLLMNRTVLDGLESQRVSVSHKRCDSGLSQMAAIEEDRQKKIMKHHKIPMCRLLSFCRPEWPLFIPALLGSVVDGGAMPAISLIMVKAMVAFFLPPEEMERKIRETCLIFVIQGVCYFVFVIMQAHCFSRIGEAMTRRVRVELLKALFRQEVGFHDNPENTPGVLSRALSLHAYRLSLFNTTVGVEIGSLTSVAAGLGIAFYYSWQMTLVILLTIPVTSLSKALRDRAELGFIKDEAQVLMTSQQLVSESVQNARTVHACGCKEDIVRLYADMLGEALRHLGRISLLSGFVYGFSSATRFFVMSGGFYWGAWLIKWGLADFEGVMAAFMGLLFTGIGVAKLFQALADFGKARLAAHDTFKLLDRPSLVNGLEPDGVIPEMSKADVGHIEFQAVHFHYPFRNSIKVLQGVNLRITPGMSVGLVGPSGGGKSTVMALLQRFYDPAGGRILVGPLGKPLCDLNVRWWRRQIGFVGQEPVLFDTSVRANVLYGLEDGQSISDDKLEACKNMANLSFLDVHGEGWDLGVGPRGGKLSGGQKQRVAICRALIRDPPLLLLDEATSALDSHNERVVQDAIEAARQGRTSISIAHRLSTIYSSDLILVMAEGKVLEHGTHTELLGMKGVYHGLHAKLRDDKAHSVVP